jgi:uncharacterized membrane protein YdjX (TVP38/TMEM64 family)
MYRMILPLLLVQWFWVVDANSLQPFSRTTIKPGNLLLSQVHLAAASPPGRRRDSKYNHNLFRRRATTVLSSSSKHSALHEVTFSLRGGESSSAEPSSSSSEPFLDSSSSTSTTTNNKTRNLVLMERIQKGILIASSTAALYGLFITREAWVGILFDKNKLQAKTLEVLHSLNSLPRLYSYIYYTAGMAIWEAIGMSTIPVETAAGMVFGWHGFFLSGMGKLSGACLAFMLGRYGVLAAWIQDRLSSNSFLRLVQDSAAENPFLVACLFKFSCFPETIKNYGSAILRPIRLWMFVLGTVVHGWTFTALWTYLGVDTAARLRDATMAPDRTLQALLTLALINGIVVSPLAMAYWVRTLQKPRPSAVVVPPPEEESPPPSPSEDDPQR